MEGIDFRIRNLKEDRWVGANEHLVTRDSTLGESFPTKAIGFNGVFEINLLARTDAKGNPVYEGDIIVRGDGMSISPDDYYVVKFGTYEYTPDDWYYSSHLGFYVGDEKDANGLDYFIDMLDCYVVGNIYDNPELLKNIK